MATQKYDFTASNGQLLATLDNSAPDFTNSEVLEYRAASVNLSNPISPQETKKILLYDYGDYEREFIFENFKTIGGVVPTDISDAYLKLRALIPSSTGGGGDASAANQVTANATLALIKAKTDNLDVAISTNDALVSTVNSSAVALGISGVFTGTAENISQYGTVNVVVFSDVASATDGLSIQQSTDGTNWDSSDNYTIPASTGKNFSVARGAKFFRIVYTNGGTAQASFRLQAIFTKGTVKSSSIRPQDSRTNDNDMEEGLSYQMLYDNLTNTWSRQAYTITVSGTITTQNLVPAGVATAGSAVEIDLKGLSGLAIQTVGTYTGALSLQVTTNGTDWITVGGTALLNINTGGLLATITSALQGIFQTEVTGIFKARITGLSAMTGSVLVTLKVVPATAMVSIDSPLPTGTNSIGNIGTVATVTTVSTLSNTTQITPGVAATNLGKAEDAAHTTGDVGIATLFLRNDALTSNTNANADYILPVTDLYGGVIVKDQQRHKRTYRCAFVVTPAATPTDVFQLIGSATTTVEITKIILSGTMTTGGMVDVYISKRSTANTGGTSSASTNVPMISTDAAATAVGAIYTANPTVGTPVGNIYIESVPFATITDKTNNIVTIDFGEKGKPVILSGVAQAIAINLNGATATGLSLKVTIEFTEY